jgi:murein DD-endopeptidase MepM/ murein hydrolase activator NlpD
MLALTGLAAMTASALPAIADVGSGGGAAAPGTPEVSGASCGKLRAWTCVRGQVLTLTGEELSSTSAIVFLGDAGRRDDVAVPVRARAAATGELLVVVPRRARSGPLKLVSAFGAEARSPQPLTVLRQAPGVDEAKGLKGLVAGGRREAVFAYGVAGTVPDGAAVEAVRVADGAVVRTWPIDSGAADGEVRWDGFAGDRPVRSGTYVLRLNEAATPVATPRPGSDSQVRVIEALFPIRAAHTIGGSAMQRFGGGRGHQGQDVFARCGAPLAALSKGVVHTASFQGAAGNYVVVDTPDGASYAYMHLREPALVQKGDRVYAGQRLGLVGDTGRASGCHLHIELWSAPGYYQGGSPMDPRPSLVRWDAVS